MRRFLAVVAWLVTAKNSRLEVMGACGIGWLLGTREFSAWWAPVVILGMGMGVSGMAVAGLQWLERRRQ